MTKVEKKQRKATQSMMKKAIRKPVKSKLRRKLQKSRPKRYMNPFLCFVHELRKKDKGVHSGSASKKMKGTYDHQMKLYRKKRQELLKSIRAPGMGNKASAKERMRQAKKAKVARRKASKTLKRKGGMSLKKVKKAKSSMMKKGKKAKSLKQRQSKNSKVNKKEIARKINARIRVTRISSTNLPLYLQRIIPIIFRFRLTCSDWLPNASK